MFAQNYTPTALRLQSFDKIVNAPSPLDSVKFRNVGPTIMSGRVVDVEVNENNTKEFFVAYASGGVWYTNNNGLSFTPIFDNEATHTIGDMAMDWTNDILWVGTGEVNSSRSSYAGTGIYKTYNRGKTWEHVGLEQSHHIGKVVLHPTNKNIAWVAALGHLYTNNHQRGVFKTMNGGRNWEQVLYINDSTGAVDLLLDVKDPNTLYTATWTRARKAWNFRGSGAGSAIYKSTDGGSKWQKITTGENGFPQGKGVGRIGIAQAESESDVLYAILDNQFNQEEEKKEKVEIKARELLDMSSEEFLKLNNKKLNDYLRKNGYPKKYTAQSTKADVEAKKYNVKQIAEWRLADADASLFETPIYGAEVYKSTDAGWSWEKVNNELLTGVYFTYGYYFGTISVSPQDKNKVWIAGYPILESTNGGQSFKQKDGENCHPDYHRVWINPKDDKHIIAANDGGINISYDEGSTWTKCNSPAVGQFYAVAVDDAKPYNVYGGLQDNGTWKGSSQHEENRAWMQNGKYGYDNLMGGDGMQIAVDTRNNSTTYVGYQFGNYARKGGGLKTKRIKPIHDIGEKAFRFNWQTPIHLSKHNQDILYYGSNCFHRSMNKGNELEKLSTDLTDTRLKGNVPFGTLTSISESPKKFGLIYVGSDDGKVWVSEDVGYNWRDISRNLPQGFWVSRVVASKYKIGRVYVSLNAYRNDNFTAYLYKSEDYGNTWHRLAKDLPYEPINVIKEDPKEENIIYVGTDNGLYVSFNQGYKFVPWRGGMPRVAVHDIAIQERANEIVVGTHGRSIYISDLSLVQKTVNINDDGLSILPISNKIEGQYLGSKWASYAKPVESILPVQFYAAAANNATVRIFNENNDVLNSYNLQAVYGWNEMKYNYQIKKRAVKYFEQELEARDDGNYYLPVGDYIIEIETADGKTAETQLKITEAK